MNSFLTLSGKRERDPPPFESNAIKYPESLVRHFLREFTTRGQNVFDPFAGLGTTLFVAEEMGRIPYGIEADGRRHEWVAGQLNHWTHLVHGDAGRLTRFGLPRMDFSMASPPFMARTHRWNPLYAGDPARAGYACYLRRLGFIYKQVAGLMKRNAMVVIHVDNIRGKSFTPLVRDISLAVSPTLKPVDEIVIAWDGATGADRHTHCLIFRNAR